MAVYSHITEKELIEFLNTYDVGIFKKFEGILEGIENTNYKITTSNNIYILTIFEKRVQIKDLPFFVNLKNHLKRNNFPCPQPIANLQGSFVNMINNKSCLLISYLKGSKTKNATAYQCEQIGEVLSLFHNYTSNFKEKRINRLSHNQWTEIFIKCKKQSIKKYESIISLIEKELEFLKNNWPINLPKGVIHADLFQDNVFFIDNQFSGMIDFYFSCNDYLAYDIALTINAWCFDKNQEFTLKNFKSFVKGYEKNRKLTKNEKVSISILLRGASIRILLTRLHDQLFHDNDAFVNPKNPNEYLRILKFHQNNNINDYL